MTAFTATIRFSYSAKCLIARTVAPPATMPILANDDAMALPAVAVVADRRLTDADILATAM